MTILPVQNVQDNKYNTREQFMKDVQLLYTNSLSYNGPDSSFTQTAKRMIEVCHDSLSEVPCLTLHALNFWNIH